jgi:hypothetical protein
MGRRIHERANLIIPSTRIKKEIKKRLPGNKFAKYAEVVATAHIQELVETFLRTAAEKVTDDEKKIYAKHLHQALNELDSEVKGVFAHRVAGIN